MHLPSITLKKTKVPSSATSDSVPDAFFAKFPLLLEITLGFLLSFIY